MRPESGSDPLTMRKSKALTAVVPLGFGLLALAISSAAPRPLERAGAAPPVRVLLISGQNNHDWRSTTPVLVSILRTGGAFQVDISEDPSHLDARALAPYDVILSNWNAFDRDAASSTWPESARKAYLDFVRQGKGHVAVHAGSSSFPDWPDYAQLTLAAWKTGRTGHGSIHEFPVRIDDPRHPVTAGLAPFRTKDELWNKPGIAEGAEVLASSFSARDKAGTDGWEPCVLAGRFGRGRTLTILLGHDVEAMGNAGFRTLLRRAVEWTARGSVTAGI